MQRNQVLPKSLTSLVTVLFELETSIGFNDNLSEKKKKTFETETNIIYIAHDKIQHEI